MMFYVSPREPPICTCLVSPHIPASKKKTNKKENTPAAIE